MSGEDTERDIIAVGTRIDRNNLNSLNPPSVSMNPMEGNKIKPNFNIESGTQASLQQSQPTPLNLSYINTIQVDPSEVGSNNDTF